MTITMRELRQMIVDGCDDSQPLRVVAYDVGKKGEKHTTVRTDENFPARLSVTPGMYDDRGVIEFAHDPECPAIMASDFIEAIDKLLEEKPKSTVGWVYFFYFPLEYAGFLGRPRKMESCLLDTNNVQEIYVAKSEPNTLVIKAEYGLGSFDML